MNDSLEFIKQDRLPTCTLPMLDYLSCRNRKKGIDKLSLFTSTGKRVLGLSMSPFIVEVKYLSGKQAKLPVDKLRVLMGAWI